jgi:hypothetical protein
MPEKLASSSSSGAKKTKEIMATVPSRDPTGGHREDSEISTTNFLHGAAILEFINFEVEIVSESDLRGSFIVSEKSALVRVCVPPKALSVELGNFFFVFARSLSLSLSSTALELPHLSRLPLLCRVSASKLKNFASSYCRHLEFYMEALLHILQRLWEAWVLLLSPSGREWHA